MSVRSGLLLLLSTAPAYGLQLHSELERRTDRVGRINVGQIYSTLERLVAAGLVTVDGATDDGLPLYAATESGRRAAAEWSAEARVDGATAWSEMVFRVLLVLSLEGESGRPLLGRYRDAWQGALDARAAAGDAPDPAASATRALARAALEWIGALAELPGGLDPLRQPLGGARPRRGRPAAAAQRAG